MAVARAGLIAGILVGFISGCGEGGDKAVSDSKEDKPRILVGHADDEAGLPDGFVVHKARDPDSPPRVNRTPIVIDDRAEIVRTKEVFERGLSELYDRAMTQIADGEWVYFEHTFALRQRREKAIADLHGMMENRELLPAARTKAAEKLVALGDGSGEVFLFDSLQSESAELRLAALASLREWDLKVDFSKTDRAHRILALLRDPDERIVKAAAQLVVYRSISGAEEILVPLLERGELENPTPIAEELASVASSRRAVDVLLPLVLNPDASEFSQSTGYRLDKLVKHSDPEISGPARRALYDYTLRFEKQRYDQILVEYLAKAAGPDATPVLEDILEKARDPISRTYALGALARLQPEKAMDLLVEHAKREGMSYSIVCLLQQYACEDDFDRIAAVVTEWLQKSGRQLGRETVRLFLEDLGGRGEQFVKDHMDILDEDARMWATWKFEGLDLLDALGELREADVIRSAPAEVIARMQATGEEGDEGEPVDTSDPDSLMAALMTYGIVTMFDAETGTIPCDHDRLILQFAEGANGQFAAQWPVQFWHRKDEEDYDGPYTVQFVYKDRLYQTGAENYGDWYDADAMVRLVNFALETAGQFQRFIALDSSGQIASFVFADPKAFLPIAAKYGLPLSDDASKAMRMGIEFEQRVIEGMK